MIKIFFVKKTIFQSYNLIFFLYLDIISKNNIIFANIFF